VLLVIHGRSLCRNRKPDCLSCPLVDVCPEAFMASDDRGTYVVELRR
jgi:endonuclease III